MEDKPRKRIPKVKISITISKSVWDKIVRVQDLSGATPSSIINYILKNDDENLDELIQYYEDPKNQKEEEDV